MEVNMEFRLSFSAVALLALVGIPASAHAVTDAAPMSEKS
jgi:hypothetical protein